MTEVMQKEIYFDFKTMNDPLEWVRVGLIAVPKNNYFFFAGQGAERRK
jgi:hypothetical protein